MAKTITITFEGTEYTLEFTRKSIQDMERNGFVASNIDSKPMTVLPDLFAGAFLAHHRFVKREVIDRIFAHLKDKYLLVEKLAEMYNDPFETLMGEPEDNEGNAAWGASW